ncbi:protein STRUBBELIG-RECEPTOR FAMILY 7-like [Arachis ipaensis]|uniref:protein STRUBBELIG-RECEPTOR FAMILY 7-like n=1 Tax=Arachis ipaensis TaxID=130454 RepID=UPI0007AF539F|nr:protein STRUBBELIG-RECEPTOR FAMILY 7-like [Arachis ipaensis]
MEPGSMQSSNRKSPEINLAELGLSERIGKGLEKLQHLMVLSLSHNNFNGCITHPLTLFSTIQNLNLSHNGFSGQIPASFLNMSSIRSLDLSHNSFSGHIPQSFFDSYNFLHYFSLSNNMFEGQIPSRISRCSSLNSIDLSNNRFAGYIDFVVVWSLSRLRILTKRVSRNEHAFRNKGRTTTPSNGSSDGGSSNTRATPGEQNGGSNDAAAPNGKQRQRTTSAAVKGSGDGDGSEAGRHGHTNRSPPFADLSLSPQASLTLNLASGCPGSSTTAIAHSGVVPCSGSPSSRHWSRPPPSELHGLSLSSGFLLRDGNGGNGTGSSRAAIRRQLHKSTATRLGRSSSVVTALLVKTATNEPVN